MDPAYVHEVRVGLSRLVEHLGGEVDSHDVGCARRERARHPADAAADVDHSLVWIDGYADHVEDVVECFLPSRSSQ